MSSFAQVELVPSKSLCSLYFFRPMKLSFWCIEQYGGGFFHKICSQTHVSESNNILMEIHQDKAYCIISFVLPPRYSNLVETYMIPTLILAYYSFAFYV
ncbi:mitochondrial outer membrane protein porin 6 [Iris pallida]|uniref:Mitochondrial outer membrane protein porin 6 n=1 Tax=Iris pallida TaxID=29817 RepID=A0AAX6IE73_IRIPA|nr:mitochondrial outer membrane protein porin 6 [Iris pallida]